MKTKQFTLMNRLGEIVKVEHINEVEKIIESLTEVNHFKRVLESNLTLQALKDNTKQLLEDKFKIDSFKIEIEINNEKIPFYSEGEITEEFFRYISNFLDDLKINFYLDNSSLNGYEKMVLNSYIQEIAHFVHIHYIFTNLEKATTTDPLTNLKSRLSFSQEMETLIPLALREKMNIGFLLINIDRFRAVNDEHGNNFGDQFLKLYADTLKNTIRSSDIAVRFGGGEFLVLLMNVDGEDKTMEIAEKIKDKLAQTYLLSPNGDHFKKTVSIGVSMFPEDSTELDELINFASIALVDAQTLGRSLTNRYTSNEQSTIDLF